MADGAGWKACCSLCAKDECSHKERNRTKWTHLVAITSIALGGVAKRAVLPRPVSQLAGFFPQLRGHMTWVEPVPGNGNETISTSKEVASAWVSRAKAGYQRKTQNKNLSPSAWTSRELQLARQASASATPVLPTMQKYQAAGSYRKLETMSL